MDAAVSGVLKDLGDTISVLEQSSKAKPSFQGLRARTCISPVQTRLQFFFPDCDIFVLPVNSYVLGIVGKTSQRGNE